MNGTHGRSAPAIGWPMNPTDLIRKFHQALPQVRQWVEDTLVSHREQAVPVDREEYLGLAQVFPSALLKKTGVVTVAETPPFPPLSRMGLPELARFEAMPMTGVTYKDIFFVRRGHRTESLYFHEIVHVVQWDHLGVERFLLAYGAGLMQFGYRRSPLEAMAYALQNDFDRASLPEDLMGRIQQQTNAIWDGVAALF
jgi:hypothetical protein